MKNKLWKKTMALFLTGALVLGTVPASSLQAQAEEPDINTGLVGYYNFDAEEGEETKSFANSAPKEGAESLLASAVVANGEIGLSDDAIDGMSAKFTGTNWATIESAYTAKKPATYSFWIKPGDGNGSGPSILHDKNGRSLVFYAGGSGVGTYLDGKNHYSGTSMSVGQWYHVAMTIRYSKDANDEEPNGVQLYVNGVPAGAFNKIVADTDNKDSILIIGAHKDGHTNFIGLMDNLRIYNTDLTAETVKEIYESERPEWKVTQQSVLTTAFGTEGTLQDNKEEQVSHAESHTFTTEEKQGYDFKGWYDNPNPTSTESALSTETEYTVSVQSNLTVYAVYEQKCECEITEANVSASVGDQSVELVESENGDSYAGTINMGSEKSVNVALTVDKQGSAEKCGIESHKNAVPAVTYSGANADENGNGNVTISAVGTVTVTVTVTLGKKQVVKTVVLTVTSTEFENFKSEVSKVETEFNGYDKNIYDETTYNALKNAINEAKELAESGASSDALSSALQAITSAKAGLKTKAQVERENLESNLNNAISEAEGMKDQAADYTADSWKAFEEALEKAKGAYADKANKSDTELNEALTALTGAKDGLVTKAEAEKAAAKKSLDDALAEAQRLYAAGRQPSMSQSDWDAFVKAYQTATDGNTEDADAASLTALLNALKKAQNTLAGATTPQKETKLSAPTIKSAKAQAYKKGVQAVIDINAVAGADHYEVYCVVGGKATLAGTTTSGAAVFKDTKLKSRNTSYYAVAVSKDGTVKSTNGAAVKVSTAASAKIKKASKKSGAVRLTWKKVKSAKRYMIYRSTKKSSGYTRIKTLRKGTSYVDKKAKKLKKAKTLYYKLVVVDKSGVASVLGSAKKVKNK